MGAVQHRQAVRRHASKTIEPGREDEEWRQAVGYDCLVSNHGRVRGLSRVLGGWKDSDGYPRVHIKGPDGFKQVPIHTLVAEAFIGPRPSPAHTVAHGDGVKTNNVPANLRWATMAGQYQDRVRHGTQTPFGEGNWNASLTNAQAAEIRRDYRPRSRTAGYPALARRYGVSKFVIYRVIRLGAYA